MSHKYRRYWNRTGSPLHDHLVCPKCGVNSPDRVRRYDDRPKLFCDCEGSNCFDFEDGELVWRRSPCPKVRCGGCGWVGVLKSRQFERVYTKSRCPRSDNGWHDVVVRTHRNKIPGPLTINVKCKVCGAEGTRTIDAITGIVWSEPRREVDDENS